MNDQKKPSRSLALAVKLIYAALSILRDSGKEMRMRDFWLRSMPVRASHDLGAGIPALFDSKSQGREDCSRPCDFQYSSGVRMQVLLRSASVITHSFPSRVS